MRILITGGTGFIGRHIIPLLVNDHHEILLLTRKDLSIPETKILIGDLKVVNQLEDRIIDFAPEACIHLAWEGIPDFSYEQSKQNFDHSMNLIQLLVNETPCQKIIASGSCWEYGRSEGVCHEDDLGKTTSFFSWAKNSIYTCASLLCRDRNIDLIWLRLFFVFGPGQRDGALIPTLYNAFKNGKQPDIKNLRSARDFIDVKDVADAFRLSLVQSIDSGIYNIGRGEPVTVSDIYKIVERRMSDKTSDLPPLSEAQNSVEAFWADTSKFQNATGWRPQISIQNGIQNQIEFLEMQ